MERYNRIRNINDELKIFFIGNWIGIVMSLLLLLFFIVVSVYFFTVQQDPNYYDFSKNTAGVTSSPSDEVGVAQGVEALIDTLLHNMVKKNNAFVLGKFKISQETDKSSKKKSFEKPQHSVVMSSSASPGISSEAKDGRNDSVPLYFKYVTIIGSLIALIFLILKYSLDMASFRKSLFEKRFELFSSVNSVLWEWASSKHVSKEMTNKISNDFIWECHFLFCKVTFDFIKRIRGNLIYFQSYQHLCPELKDEDRVVFDGANSFLRSLVDGEELARRFPELKISRKHFLYF